MKLLVLTLSILSSSAVYSGSAIDNNAVIYSIVSCGEGHVEGPPYKSLYLTYKTCYKKDTIIDSYHTAKNIKCEKDFTAGKLIYIQEGVYHKECLKKETLPSFYEVHPSFNCADDYLEEATIYEDDRFDYKKCYLTN